MTPAPTSVGRVLKDRYKIVRELSRGGFGRVFLAHDQQLHDRPVVVKIKLDQAIEDPWFERKFSEELRALTLIDHPSVVGALDSGRTADGKPYLVMQYIEGVTLRSVLAPEGLPLGRVANLIRQIGQGLGAAHDKQIWHRDLKPDNIMLQMLPGGDERVKLIDFGIATIANLDKKDTRTRVAGSLAYMAPEQVAGQPSAVTDIYAFGVIAYEMLTGRKPFAPDDTAQLSTLQRAGVRLKPSTLRPEISGVAEKLILQALNYNPIDRPLNARLFGECLSQSLLAAETTRTTQTRGLSPGRHIWAFTGVLALAVGAVWLYREPSAQKRPEPPKQAATAPVAEPADAGVELAFWNSINTSTDPRLYREYLAKYPQGKFASLAKLKLEPPSSKITGKQATSEPTASPNRSKYAGPLRGELRWAGSLEPGATLTIQGSKTLLSPPWDRGQPGVLAGELPQVPIALDPVTDGVSVVDPPSAANQWDRVAVRNEMSRPLTSVQLRWRVLR